MTTDRGEIKIRHCTHAIDMARGDEVVLYKEKDRR